MKDEADMGIDILTPSEIAAGEPGAAVVVSVNGSVVGIATGIAGTSTTLFQYTFGPGELATTFIPSGGGGGLNAISGVVQYYDGTDFQDRFGDPLPLLLTLDQTPPVASTPDLLPSSDSGTYDDDNETSIEQPTFAGVGEPGAKVQLRANNAIVGCTFVDSQGEWVITSAPLVIGDYSITVRLEDLAGNISTDSPSLDITITEDPLVERVENLEEGLTDLTELVGSHTHEYLTGQGKGHNNTVADTTPPTGSSG